MHTEIYKFLQQIPKWKVTTYKVIADKFDTHPRAVWKIMNINQDPITYPCYKVIRSNGEIWWYEPGCDAKIKKLEADGIKIVNWKIDKKFIWYWE